MGEDRVAQDGVGQPAEHGNVDGGQAPDDRDDRAEEPGRDQDRVTGLVVCSGPEARWLLLRHPLGRVLDRTGLMLSLVLQALSLVLQALHLPLVPGRQARHRAGPAVLADPP
jgi:hypothetical protein